MIIPCAKQHCTAYADTLLLSFQLCEAFDLLGAAANSDLVLELDGFTVISNSPLSLFRDGDTVIIRSKQKWQTATVPVTNGRQVEGGKRKRSEVALALTAAGNHGKSFDQALPDLCCAVDGTVRHVAHLLRMSQTSVARKHCDTNCTTPDCT